MIDLFPDGDFTFIAGGGVTTDERGKAHWPALLRVAIPKDRAWQVVREILFDLEDRGASLGEGMVTFTLVGAIERHNDDGNVIPMDGGEA
jgi:hypothetical protein